MEWKCESLDLVVTEGRSIFRPLKAENHCRELNKLFQVKFCRIYLKIVNMLIFFWKNYEFVSELSF